MRKAFSKFLWWLNSRPCAHCGAHRVATTAGRPICYLCHVAREADIYEQEVQMRLRDLEIQAEARARFEKQNGGYR